MNEICTTYNINIKGKGEKPLLFAHGMGCDQNVWKYVTPAFEEEYKIILFDYIGSGGSDFTRYNKQRYANLNGYAEDVLQICTALDLKDVVFIGHSVSSMIGMLAAIQQPSLFEKLVMIGPSPYYLNEPSYAGGFDREDIEQLLTMMQSNYRQWSGMFAPKVMGNKERPELSKTLHELFCKADPEITTDFARATFLSDHRKELSLLETPVLILQPAEDIVAPRHVGEYVHSRLRNSTLHYMTAKGHFPHLSAVEETATAIQHFLKENKTS